MTGNRLKTSTPQTLEFRRPPLSRVGMAMGSVLFLVMGVLLPADQTARWHTYDAWYSWLPICWVIAVLIAFAAGPQEVCIDLESRTGYGRSGWPFFAKRRDFVITDTSFLWLYREGSMNLTHLCIKNPPGAKKKWERYLLETFRYGNAVEALRYYNSPLEYIQEVQMRLPLPIREMTALELRDFDCPVN